MFEKNFSAFNDGFNRDFVAFRQQFDEAPTFS